MTPTDIEKVVTALRQSRIRLRPPEICNDTKLPTQIVGPVLTVLLERGTVTAHYGTFGLSDRDYA